VDIDAGFFPQIKRKADEAHATNVQTVLGKYTDSESPAKNIDLVFSMTSCTTFRTAPDI